MKITALKTQIKNPERVSVFVDTKYSFSLTLNDILECKLKSGIELSDADVTVLKKRSADGKIKARAYEWLLNRPRSVHELKRYLYGKKVEAELQQQLVEYFIDKNVVNDERYAQWATERLLRKNKSIKEVQASLQANGINKELLHDIGLDSAASDAESLQNTIQKVSGRSKYADQKKLIAYLMSKGFIYADIKDALMLREPEAEL